MKIHVIVDEGLKPIAVAISPGKTHNSKCSTYTIR
jgi:hypothetical protein